MAKMYESPQTAPDGLSTRKSGGDMPTEKDIIKSTNARGGKRHEMQGDKYADMNVLPESGGESLDKAGIKDNGYLVKKGLEYGNTAMYNSLPPGMDIEDQENIDSRKMELKNYSGGISYPGDGWT